MSDANKKPDINKKISENLFNQFSEETPYASNAKYQDHLLSQYELYVEMADRISSKRHTANSFFLSINTALVGLLSYLSVGGFLQPSNLFSYPVTMFAITGIGIALNYLWYRIIRSYKSMNTAKFKVIHEIEKHLPLRPYDAEWEAAGRGKDPKLHLPFTNTEIAIPWIFIAVFAPPCLWFLYRICKYVA